MLIVEKKNYLDEKNGGGGGGGTHTGCTPLPIWLCTLIN